MEETCTTYDVVLSSTLRKMKPESYQPSRCNLTTNLENILRAELPVNSARGSKGTIQTVGNYKG